LLNLKGEVVGMNTAIFSSTGEFAGIGFAIPSNTIKKVVPSLINTGSYTHPWIGIAGTDITPEIAYASGLDEARGFLVTDVTANSPADKSGIRGGYKISDIHGKQIPLGGDVIQAIDNKTIRKIEDMLTYLEREKNVGDAINLTIFRDGKPAEINLTLAARPDSGQQALLQKEQRPSLGISGTNITPGIAKALNLTQIREEFLVLDIIEGGPADKAGIRGGDKIASINGTEIRLGGDVITKIDNQTVRKLDDMLDYLRTKEVGDVSHLQVLRDGKIMNIAITLGTNQGLSNPTEQLLPPDSNIQPSPSPDLPNLPFDDFYGKCTELVGKEICDRMFGK
jgi:serine protease Do